MLHANDLKLFREIMEEVVGGHVARLEERMDQLGTRIDQLNTRIDQVEAQLNARIDQLDSRIDHVEAQLNARIDQLDSRIDQVEIQLTARIDQVEWSLLDELERTRVILEQEINTVDNKVANIAEYYRIRQLEDDNTAILLKLHDELEKRVAKLEERAS